MRLRVFCLRWRSRREEEMATGDVRGNFERLKVQLRSISYPHTLDLQGCRDGLPAAILPLVHYALLGYSRHIARYLNVNGYVLYAKSDLRFVECVIKLLRKEFDYRCPLTVAQVFARGFAEKKFLFVHDLIQMCKRKHNDLLRVVRNSEKKNQVCQPKAFGTVLRTQRTPLFRNKHLSSKFDRRCELDLLPDAKCPEICRRSACQENSWAVPEECRTRLSAVADGEESIRAQSLERAKNHGLRVLTRSTDREIDEKCRMHPSMLPSKSSPRRTHAVMGAQMIYKEHGYGLSFPEPVLGERNYDPEATSPRSSCPGFDRLKQRKNSGDDCTPECPTKWASREGSAALRRDITKAAFVKDGHLKPALTTPNLDHNFESFDEPVLTSNNAEGQLHTPHTHPVPSAQMTTCPSKEGCLNDHLNENRLTAPEVAGRSDAPAHTTIDDPPQAVWQKIIDLAGKIDSCFCSLDSKIAHSFNSLDDKLETKFKYLDEGVTCTRESLQDKLNVLENRIDHLERTSQISPMSFQTNVTYNEDGHPIRDITNTFNNTVDNGSWRNFTGLQSRDPQVYYPYHYQQQDMQTIPNMPMYAGILKASTQDFIASVRARFHQTKEMLKVNDNSAYGA
ncbi:hypothetical protein KC19_2G173300 [Ceratodon purpureus]|uniref:Centrosomal protein of 44 kDa n=1 Tax=Ceratodon purpureus TaxID=3225 RepID=A0A8T0IXY7_CERPU|nr:hypothetical protein KC19_2G173300 [Ceratodon purpureus]KAG0587557.1 hypothetical protein KC19_2G173300 [Ceratodon purpureus]KAG0587561.1 hypothetical protein KC19_2G173300 [Ceratodon purpureus]